MYDSSYGNAAVISSVTAVYGSGEAAMNTSSSAIHVRWLGVVMLSLLSL